MLIIEFDITNGYEPHDKQIPFHSSPAKFRAIITGIGFGKSCAGANDILKLALQRPNTTHLIIAPNTKIMVHATLVQFWSFCPKEIVANEVKSENTINLVNGSRIIYLTADNERHIDRLRGIEISSFWADEAALFHYLLWKVILGRLREPNGQLRGTITTTPKGLNWVYYLFVKNVDPETRGKLNRPNDYAWFGGTTLDNPYTPEDYKQTLIASYKGKWAEQELYGKFVGYEGLVYKNFSMENNVLNRVPILKEYIYAIDWGFTNPMACLIIGYDSDGRAYLVREYYRKRQKVSDVINWVKIQQEKYGDKLVQGYADPSEPEHIQQCKDAGLNVYPANNEVASGINDVYGRFELEKDGKPRLYIHKRCINTIEELITYRYPDVKEDREVKEAPLKINDHLCFDGSTPILTISGNKKIKDIIKGELVLTRDGWKPVLKNDLTNSESEVIELTLSNGKKIICTPNHPFWVESLGWVRADALRYKYKLIDANRYLWKQLNLMDEVIPKPKKMVTGDGQGEDDIYTEIYGKNIMELYLKNITSITKIKIKIITLLKTLNVYLQKNIIKDINGAKKDLRKDENILIKSNYLPKNGTEVKMGVLGIGNIGKSICLNCSKIGNIFVSTAVRNLYLVLHKVLNSVIQIVNRKICVLGVRKLKRKVPVYNLLVKDCHEYFANSVLVHNCDAFRYGIHTHKFGNSGFMLLDDPDNLFGLH